MKIGLITSDKIPSIWANSIFVMKMAQAFSNLGHDVEVIASNSLGTIVRRLKYRDIETHYGLKQPPNIRYLSPSIMRFFKGRTAGDPTYCHNAVRYSKQGGFDFIFCRSYIVPYLAVLREIPVFVETHTTYYDQPDLRKLYEVADRKHFLGLVTIHETIKEAHVKRGIDERKILVLEDGVDIDSFSDIGDRLQCRKILGLDPQKKYGVYTGHLYPEKGIDFIIDTAKWLQDRIDASLLIVGGFRDDIRYWKNYAGKKGVNNVEFIGFVAQGQIPVYQRAADCLLLPFNPRTESQILDINTTSPLKLFEYMACGTPIVASAVPTVTKVLENGRNALLAEPNIEDFRNKVLSALSNPGQYQHMGKNARLDARQYSWDNRARAILDHFRNWQETRALKQDESMDGPGRRAASSRIPPAI